MTSAQQGAMALQLDALDMPSLLLTYTRWWICVDDKASNNFEDINTSRLICHSHWQS